MTHVIHINDGVGASRPIVLHLLPGAEDILEIQVMNHGEPTNIFLEASSSLKKAVRFKKANHFLEQELIVPALVKMPSKADRLDGEILVDSDESIHRVPITMVREGAGEEDGLLDEDDDLPRGRSSDGYDQEDGDDGYDDDDGVSLSGRDCDYDEEDSDSDNSRQYDEEGSDDDLGGNGHRRLKSYGDVPDFSEPSTYKITQIQKNAPRYKITQASKAQPVIQGREDPDLSPSYGARSAEKRSHGRRSSSSDHSDADNDDGRYDSSYSSYDSGDDSSSGQSYDTSRQEWDSEDSGMDSSSYGAYQNSGGGSDDGSGRYDGGAREHDTEGSSDSSYDGSYEGGQDSGDFGQDQDQENSGFLPLPLAPLIMLVLLVAMLVMTFYSETIPEFTGALISSILIVTLIIYGAATLLKA